ncbi:Plasmodium exported protein, unknown function [Plasmodium gonderi]|uniref:Variable surface protein n=1 Tax=Plasmodium gonderi TaxID=77519 RepID=A0A1Y1JUZ1_PLAGO|nr:Plasmodium exported protein, unknown function [Plasmodium gonderi]GAW84233.1 Plasmodium exported protein, unknown function [Plasmodium gonderi]
MFIKNMYNKYIHILMNKNNFILLHIKFYRRKNLFLNYVSNPAFISYQCTNEVFATDDYLHGKFKIETCITALFLVYIIEKSLYNIPKTDYLYLCYWLYNEHNVKDIKAENKGTYEMLIISAGNNKHICKITYGQYGLKDLQILKLNIIYNIYKIINNRSNKDLSHIKDYFYNILKLFTEKYNKQERR